MRTIESYDGAEIIVDEDDFETLSGFRWFYRSKGNVTLSTSMKSVFRKSSEKSTYITMAREITKCDIKNHVIFLDDNNLNHQKGNLKVLTLAELRRRVLPQSGRKYKGTSLNKTTGKYTAAITLSGKTIFLGYRQIERSAAQIYDAALYYLGFTYAYYNFPGEKFELPKHLKKKLRKYKNESPKV